MPRERSKVGRSIPRRVGVMYRRVSSSSIAEVGYDASAKTLAIRFHNGREYWYADFPPATLEALLGAPSIGAFFQAEIRDSYPFQRIR